MLCEIRIIKKECEAAMKNKIKNTNRPQYQSENGLKVETFSRL